MPVRAPLSASISSRVFHDSVWNSLTNQPSSTIISCHTDIGIHRGGSEQRSVKRKTVLGENPIDIRKRKLKPNGKPNVLLYFFFLVKLARTHIGGIDQGAWYSAALHKRHAAA